MTTLDDDRRDIAVMGSESAWELNRLAHRNHGADPLPISGDAITRQTKKKRLPPMPMNAAAASNQCQTNLKEAEMTTPNSTQTGSVKHPSWSIPAKMQGFGRDLVHNGTTYSLERSNENGDEYSLRARVTQLEEVGYGFTTDPYVSLDVDSGPFGTTHLNLDIAELETMADWLCGLVEKVQHLKPQP